MIKLKPLKIWHRSKINVIMININLATIIPWWISQGEIDLRFEIIEMNL